MPRLDSSETDPEQVVRLQIDAMVNTPDNDEEVMDNRTNSIQNTTTQSQQRPQQQLKLPNFLSSPMENLANYLGPVPPGLVAPRSSSVDQKLEKIRTEGGGWAWTRVQSSDREKKIESPIISFISPRSSRAMNMGAVCQVSDSYQNSSVLDHDEAAQADEGQFDEDSMPSSDADCLVG